MRRVDAMDLSFEMVGAASLVLGASMAYEPAGWIVAGILLILAGNRRS